MKRRFICASIYLLMAILVLSSIWLFTLSLNKPFEPEQQMDKAFEIPENHIDKRGAQTGRRRPRTRLRRARTRLRATSSSYCGRARLARVRPRAFATGCRPRRGRPRCGKAATSSGVRSSLITSLRYAAASSGDPGVRRTGAPEGASRQEVSTTVIPGDSARLSGGEYVGP